MRSSLTALYSRLPYRWRVRDRAFRSWTARFARHDALSEEKLRVWQFEELRRFVRHAYTQTAFYRERFDAAGFHPDALRAPEDMSRIPMTTRDDVRRNATRMIAGGRPLGSLWVQSTSGTTGSPLTLYTDRLASSREFAAICWQWANAGYRPGMGRVEFRGLIAGDEPCVMIPFEGVLRVNVHTLHARVLPQILLAIERSEYHFFHGYPSAIEKFCELLSASGRRASVRPPTAILLSSEVVYDRQRERIRAVFPESRLVAHYGQAERVAVGAWHDDCGAYHFLPGHGWVEQDVETGELVGTGFGNEVMPLVRYRLRDVAEGFQHAPHPHVPTRFPVVERIGGRLEDSLCKPDGEHVPPALVTFPFKQGRTFASCQLIQHAYDQIEIMVQPSAPEMAVREEFATVIEKLRLLFGPTMRFEITLVDEIPRMASGKFRWLENRIQEPSR